MVRTDDLLYVTSLLIPDEDEQDVNIKKSTTSGDNKRSYFNSEELSASKTTNGSASKTTNGTSNGTSNQTDIVFSVSDAISDIAGFASELIECEFFYFSATCLAEQTEFQARFTKFLKYNYKKNNR